jgi:predicted aconitase with swiveling domain
MQAVQVEDLCHQQLKEDGRVLSHPSLKGSGAGSSAVMERESNLSEALVMVH